MIKVSDKSTVRSVRYPTKLWAEIKKSAKKNRRAISGELVVLLEKALNL